MPLTRRGFTILEMIVVIAIIAMLLGLSGLTLSGVRSAGRNVKCLNNLRQMSIGARQYALQYNYFPPAIRYERRDGVLMRFAVSQAMHQQSLLPRHFAESAEIH